MLLEHRLLTLNAELALFSQLYADKSHGIPADITFLKQGDVRVFFYEDQPDRWVAGFVTSQNAPSRYLAAHTPEARAALLAQHGFTEADIAEIGAIWMDVRSLLRHGRELSKQYRWGIYQQMMGDAYATGKPIIMGGTVNPMIRDFQTQVTKYPFFAGELTLGGKTQQLWQYYAHRHEFWNDFFQATLREFGIVHGHTGVMALAA